MLNRLFENKKLTNDEKKELSKLLKVGIEIRELFKKIPPSQVLSSGARCLAMSMESPSMILDLQQPEGSMIPLVAETVCLSLRKCVDHLDFETPISSTS